MDPRIKTSLADLQKQFAMQSGSSAGMNESFEALAQVRSVRAQLMVRAAKPGRARLRMRSRHSTSRPRNWRVQRKAISSACRPAQQPENFSSLNQHFGGLLSVADSAMPRPHASHSVYGELEGDLEKLTARWTKIRQQDIPATQHGTKESWPSRCRSQ